MERKGSRLIRTARSAALLFVITSSNSAGLIDPSINPIQESPNKIIVPNVSYSSQQPVLEIPIVKPTPIPIIYDSISVDTELKNELALREQHPTIEMILPIPNLDMDMYAKEFVRFQPDNSTCVPTATLIMLNLIKALGSYDQNFKWQTTISVDKVWEIRAWARAHDTLVSTGRGSDPNGWKYAISYFAGGEYKDPQKRIYEDKAYETFDEALKDMVKSIALYDKPVGYLGWSGSHAQIINGFETEGNPSKSDDFIVKYVYITDPLPKDGIRNVKISYEDFRYGSSIYSFRPYKWRDSPYDDPYSPGNIRADKKWYGKYVGLVPTRR